MRILLRIPNWVGDAVICLPAIEAVRDSFPGSSITVLARPWVAPIMEVHPAIDHVIQYKRPGKLLQNLKEMFSIITILNRKKFDLAILFQNAFEAAFIAWCARIPSRVGYGTDRRGFLLTRSLKIRRQEGKDHQIHYYLGILEAMGLKARYKEPRIYLPPSVSAEARKRLAGEGVRDGDLLVGLGPGAMFGGAKRWPPEDFASVGERASRIKGSKLVILGSKGEKDIAQAVERKLNGLAVNLCGKTELNEAVAVIGRCNVFVTNDSGLMHVAAAMGVPTVAVFGPTDPSATGPVGAVATYVRAEVECAPCLKAECPGDHKCMNSVTVDMVWREVERLLTAMQQDTGGLKR